MREILFRGKTTPKNNGEEFNEIWIKGDLIRSKGLCYIHPIANVVIVQSEIGRLIAMHEVIPETVGQFTGLTDKNGKRIFEGDIIKTKKYGKDVGHSNVNDYDIFVVKYEPAMFRLENRNRSFVLDDDGYSKYEVIGNIHDNPELLEVNNE